MRLDAMERKVLVVSAFIATLLLMPLGGRITSLRAVFRERIPALSALGVALVLLMWHVWRSRSEAPPAPPPVAKPPEAPPTQDPSRGRLADPDRD